MDWIPGGDLWFHLKKEKNGFPKKAARFFAAELVLAMEHLHSFNVVYRDLKPENVLIDGEGHICLADFGISKIIDEDTRTNSIVGTTCFMAPEVIKGEPYDLAVDWWSFGVLLYHMLTGRHPFYASNKMEIIEKIMTKKIGPYPGCPTKKGFLLLEQLLYRDPKKRLSDVKLIKKQPFFKKIEWDKLLLKKVKPPFTVNVKGSHDLSNFEAEMKNKPVFTQSENRGAPPADDETYFSDFTYANPNVV